MVSEKHLRGTEFGPLQLAVWAKQFTASRDGDRFFYAGDPTLARMAQLFHVDYRVSLARVVFLDTGEQIPAQAFKAPVAAPAAAAAPTPAPAGLAPAATAEPSTTTGPSTSTSPAPSSSSPTGPTTTTSTAPAPGPPALEPSRPTTPTTGTSGAPRR